jgi:hypothetical protein
LRGKVKAGLLKRNEKLFVRPANDHP